MAEKDLIVNDFSKGIALSPSTGFEEIRYLDVHSSPGAVQINLRPIATSGITGLVNSFLPAGEYISNDFAVDDTGKLYINAGIWVNFPATYSTSEFKDFVQWEGYLVLFTLSDIRLYNVSSGSPSWYTDGSAWQSIAYTGADFRTALVSSNGNLYFANGRYVASLSKTGTFNPATGTTYNLNQQALDLPPGYKIKTIVEFGRYLAIGAYKGNGGGLQRVADVFFWDTFSSSFEDNIFRLNEFGVHQMVVENNELYIVAGREGSVYISNGTSVEKLRSLPRHITMTTNNRYLDFMPKAIMTHKGRIYFGVSSGTTTEELNGIGVWSIDRNGVLVFEDRMSQGFTDGNQTKIGALLPVGTDKYYFSWKTSAQKGTDTISSTDYYSNYTAYFTSPLYVVGTALQRSNIKQADILLQKPLSQNEGVRISYRANRGVEWSSPKTFDYATYGAKQFANIVFPATDLYTFQVKVELTGQITTPALQEVRFR